MPHEEGNENDEASVTIVPRAPAIFADDDGGYGTVFVDTGDMIQEITGWLISEASTRGPGMQPRWTRLRLYGLTRGRYAVVTSGMSVLFHAHPSKCNTGIQQAAAMLTLDDRAQLIPCDKCKPPRASDLTDGDTISRETDINSVTECDSAEDVVMSLLVTDPVTRDTFLSGPARRLLKEAQHDPGIRMATTKHKKIA